MKDVISLANELKAHLSWHQARTIFLAQFILGLIRGRSCNLYRAAEEFQSKSQAESSYRRIKRFFSGIRGGGDGEVTSPNRKKQNATRRVEMQSLSCRQSDHSYDALPTYLLLRMLRNFYN
ncbi:MAG: hypothetical protein KAG53_04015 [Endozoicomonadaceae bacterium]|nr:hypothetical protein [Endozoicomonadaceae bacterium]